MRLVILFNIILNPSFKMAISSANIAKTMLAQVNLYNSKYFESLGIGSWYEKYFLTLNEQKTSLMLKFSLQNSSQTFESLFFDMVWKVVDIW